MLNPIKFLKLTRLFEMRPLPLSRFSFWLLLIAFCVIVIAGIVCIWRKRRKSNDTFLNKFYTNIIALSFTSGISGLALLGFRQWRVYLFGARFWLLIWFIGFATWLGFVIRYLVKVIPERRNAKEADELFGKYLPKKKK